MSFLVTYMCKKTERKIYSNLLSFRIYDSPHVMSWKIHIFSVILTQIFNKNCTANFFDRVRSTSIIYRRYVVTYITSFRSENTLNIEFSKKDNLRTNLTEY